MSFVEALKKCIQPPQIRELSRNPARTFLDEYSGVKAIHFSELAQRAKSGIPVVPAAVLGLMEITLEGRWTRLSALMHLESWPG